MRLPCEAGRLSEMTSFLPIVFLAALLLSAWLTYSKPDTSIPWPRWGGALILVFGLILASRHFASQTQAGTIMVGGVVGAAAACIGAGLGLIRAEGPAQLALAGASGGIVYSSFVIGYTGRLYVGFHGNGRGDRSP